VGKSLEKVAPDQKLAALISKSAPGKPAPDDTWTSLLNNPAASRSLLSSEMEKLQKRVLHLEELSKEIHRRSVRKEMLRILAQEKQESIDLFHAAILIAKLDNEELDIELYRKQLDLMAAELTESLTDEEKKDSAKRIARLTNYLFIENGFHGSRTNYYHASNSYLNEVLDDREGLPITLSVIYMELARRLDLNVVGVPLPGHFVVQDRSSYKTPEKPKESQSGTHAASELGFIDPFEGGKHLSLEDAKEMIFGFDERDLEPASKRAIIVRMLRNLIGIALDESAGKPERALPYLDLLLALSPDEARERLSRGLLRYQQEQFELAKEDIDWVLEHRPAGVDLLRLQGLRDSLDRLGNN
jgi:regulator of sirC expression with transglutaminase-like and TPR domain